MNERHERPARADDRLFVNQPHATSFQFAEFRMDVVDFDAKVMNSGAAFGYKLSDRGLGASGFEQFDATLADRQHGDANALIFHDLDALQFEAERVAPESESLLD